MNAKAAAALAGLILLGGGLAGCGNKMPRTTSNVSICRVLAATLDGTTSPQELAGPTFETDAGLSRQLREDIGQYVAQAATGHGNSASAQQAARKAETACRSIRAPVARAYGGSG